MIWTTIFLIGAIQGLFLSSLIFIKRKNNRLASFILISIILLITLTNIGFFIIRTDLKFFLYPVYILQYASILALGPLFYFYVRSIIDKSFFWRKKYILHIIPYIIMQFYLIHFVIFHREYLLNYIDVFLSGNLPFNTIGKVLILLQNLHFVLYLIFTNRFIKGNRELFKGENYIVSSSLRLKWIYQLSICFVILISTISILYIFVFINEYYNPITNYIFALTISCIIYFISYRILMYFELINPNFELKYKTIKKLDDFDKFESLKALDEFFNNKKLFLDPDLKLALLSKMINLSQHQTSKLINDNFDKSFRDFVNEFRVNEFINRINNPIYKSFSIYGLAQEVGFNSKSAFNEAFKKITGKTPSSYKR